MVDIGLSIPDGGERREVGGVASGGVPGEVAAARLKGLLELRFKDMPPGEGRRSEARGVSQCLIRRTAGRRRSLSSVAGCSSSDIAGPVMEGAMWSRRLTLYGRLRERHDGGLWCPLALTVSRVAL